MRVEPVPFHFSLPGHDTIGFEGIRSESFKVHGLLHLDDEYATFEWSTTRHREVVSFTDISEDDESTQPELLDVPVGWIAEARLTGGWWRPRLVLRGRRLDAFAGLPGARPGLVSLPVRRRDRPIAMAMAAALTDAARERLLHEGNAGPGLDAGMLHELDSGQCEERPTDPTPESP